MGRLEDVAAGAVKALVKQHGARQGRLGDHRVGAGLVQGHGVEGGEHAHVGGDGHVVFPVAVAVGGDVQHQGHVEAGTPVYHGLGVLGDFLVQDGGSLVVEAVNGVLGADRQAAAAAHALVRVDGGLAIRAELGRAMGADFGAGLAANALFLLHKGLAGVVLLHLARPGAAAHADVFQRAAHARLLVALEVGEADEHVRVHDGPSDFGLRHVLAALHGDGHLVGALQPVGDEHVAARCIGAEAVDIGGLQVVQGVLPPAHVQRVAVRQEGLASLGFHQVRHGPGPVGPEVGQVPRLAEVHFDGDKLALHVNFAKPGGHHQPGQLLGEVLPPAGAAEVRKINLGRLRHDDRSPFPYGSRSCLAHSVSHGVRSMSSLFRDLRGECKKSVLQVVFTRRLC